MDDVVTNTLFTVTTDGTKSNYVQPHMIKIWLERKGRSILTRALQWNRQSTRDIQVGQSTLLAIGSPNYFALLQAWLTRCNATHRCGAGAIAKKHLPTRLIELCDVEGNRLILRESGSIDTTDISHVALSHRWGRYTKNEKEQICTHKENLESRRQGFDKRVLPQTFQDAVEVTRQLGQRYLWIDSLCILQSLDGNQTSDWENESKRMEDVFSSAYCTLAVHTETNDHSQSFLIRQPINHQRIEVETSRGTIHISTLVERFKEEVKDSCLTSRGWVMQESILSRRVIHFGLSQTYFQCGEGVWCEDFTCKKSPVIQDYFSMDPEFPARLLKAGRYRIIDFVQNLYGDFTKRELTKGTDRSVALQGVEQRIARALTSDIHHGTLDRYMQRMLLWRRPKGKILKPIDYGSTTVPTWSWQSLYGPVEFAISPLRTMLWLKETSIKGQELRAEAAMLLNATVQQSRSDCTIVDGAGQRVGWIRYDQDDGCSDLSERKFAVLGREQGYDERYYGLVVKPETLPDEFVRVGIACVSKLHLSRMYNQVRVV